MYTIKEICSGASMMVRSVLGRKREYRILFNKEKSGCWYVDFPHWPFSHDNLAMVSGADKMLEPFSRLAIGEQLKGCFFTPRRTYLIPQQR